VGRIPSSGATCSGVRKMGIGIGPIPSHAPPAAQPAKHRARRRQVAVCYMLLQCADGVAGLFRGFLEGVGELLNGHAVDTRRANWGAKAMAHPGGAPWLNLFSTHVLFPGQRADVQPGGNTKGPPPPEVRQWGGPSVSDKRIPWLGVYAPSINEGPPFQSDRRWRIITPAITALPSILRHLHGCSPPELDAPSLSVSEQNRSKLTLTARWR